MKLISLLSTLSSLAFIKTAAAADAPEIEIVGNKFFYSNNGSQFYIKGIAYQSNSVANSTSSTSFTDPLADEDNCKRDLPYLQQLSTNVLRVYAINTSLDHSACMNLFADAGIYVLADLSEPGLSINRNDPSWNVELYTRYTDAVDALANYTNVLGFFAGNEVTNAINNTASSAYVKAAIRDTKAYLKSKSYRSIPVGYAATDDDGPRVPEANYFACGDEDDSADFYGINIYEWCGDSSYSTSGYEDRTNDYKNLSIPLFFSEYGCNAVQPRKFTEVGALYGSDMDDVWSGGIVYMYFQEENDYGLVTVSGSSVSTLADFPYLSSELASVSPSIRQSSDITTSGSTVACPASTLTNWEAATVLPPSPDASACACLDSGSACVVRDSVDEDEYGEIFDYVCDKISCDGISGNASTGVYGSFNGCNPKEQLNYVLNLYYSANGKSASNCDFSSRASVRTASTNSYCSSVFNVAGSSGTGRLSGSAVAGSTSTGTGAAATGSSSGSQSGSSASASSSSSSSSSSSGSKNAASAATQGHMMVAAGAMAAAAVVFVCAL